MFAEIFSLSLPTADFGLRLFVAAIFFLAAVHKLQNTMEFEGILGQYKIAPAQANLPLSWFVPGLELVCAGTLLFSPPIGTTLAALMLCVYAAAMGINLQRGRAHIDCGCGGKATPLSPGLIGRNLGIALGLVICQSATIWQADVERSTSSAPVNPWLATAFAVGLFALYVSYNQLQTNAGIYRRLWLGERVG